MGGWIRLDPSISRSWYFFCGCPSEHNVSLYYFYTLLLRPNWLDWELLAYSMAVWSKSSKSPVLSENSHSDTNSLGREKIQTGIPVYVLHSVTKWKMYKRSLEPKLESRSRISQANDSYVPTRSIAVSWQKYNYCRTNRSASASSWERSPDSKRLVLGS